MTRPIASAAEMTNLHTDKTRHDGALPKGTVLKERFLLTGLIATGGTSYLYKARDLLAAMSPDESSELVVKVTRRNVHDVATPTEIALHEALTTRKLSHANIVKVFDYDCDEQYCFVTMEYLSGEPLSTRLQRSADNKLSYRQAMEIAGPVAEALHYAHHQGVVHSDIKPGNIILSTEGTVKLIDFGTARPNSHSIRTSHQTNETDYSGFTPIYASPETLRDQAATVSDDVYSFACTLYEMLTGQHPFNRVTADIAEKKNIRAKRAKPINFWQWRILKKALSFSQHQRYTSISHFMKLFTRARHIWSSLIISIFLILITAIILFRAYDAFNQHIDKDEQLKAVHQELELSTNLIEHISQIPVLDRIKALDKINELPAFFRNAAIQDLRDGIITDVAAEVRHKLYNSSDVPDFPTLAGVVAEVSQYYPDSVKLNDTSRLIRQEQQEYGAALLIKYREQWDETTFTENDAHEIQLTRNKLDSLGLKAPQIDSSKYLQYIDALNSAYKQFDYLRIDQLITFKNTLSMSIPTPVIQKVLIDPLQIEAAQELAQYQRNTSDKHKVYPRLAAVHFWSPYFRRMDSVIENTWKNSKLRTLKQELSDLGEQIPADYPSLVRTRRKLAEQFRSKARYYKRKGIYKNEVLKLNKSADEILSTISSNP